MSQGVAWAWDDDGDRAINIGDGIITKTMAGEEGCDGRHFAVTPIDDAGRTRGTRGGLSLIPGDEFEVIHCESDK